MRGGGTGRDWKLGLGQVKKLKRILGNLKKFNFNKLDKTIIDNDGIENKSKSGLASGGRSSPIPGIGEQRKIAPSIPSIVFVRESSPLTCTAAETENSTPDD